MFDTFKIVLNSMISLSLCMGMGYLFRKKKIITDEVSAGMSALLIKLITPCLVITSMQRDFSYEIFSESLIMLVMGFVFHLFGTVIGLIITKIAKVDIMDKGILLFALTFPNIVYMGLPVITSIFGMEAVFYISMSNIAFNTLAFTFGIKLIQMGKVKSTETQNIKAIIFNMPILATIIGFVMFVTSFKLWYPLNEAINMTGKMTVPISMLIVGATLAKADIREIFKGIQIYWVAFIRLLFIPIMLLLVLRYFIKNEMILSSIVLMSSMPAASLTAILAANYEGNTFLASKLVFVTTLFSVVTIPIITLLISLLRF